MLFEQWLNMQKIFPAVQVEIFLYIHLNRDADDKKILEIFAVSQICIIFADSKGNQTFIHLTDKDYVIPILIRIRF